MITVAIVGRANVGKSTLFNRLTRSRQAIVADQPGVTRDRIVGTCEWRDRVFEVIDTGGLVGKGGEIEEGVGRQIGIAVAAADLLLLVVDGRAGIMPEDHKIADMLRKTAKPVALAVNKVDGIEHKDRIIDFYQLGLEGEPIPISAMHGFNVGDFLDELLKILPRGDDSKVVEEAARICIVGQPNVGKSSLLNAILGETRSVVSEEPGTTRDCVNETIEFENRLITLIDTAGLRRSSRVDGDIEYYSTLRAKDAIHFSDVVLFMLDAVSGLSHQDKKLMDEVTSRGKGLLVLANKWDLMEKELKDAAGYITDMRQDLQFISEPPVKVISAKTGFGVKSVLRNALEIRDRMMQTIPANLLDEMVSDAVARIPPPSSPTGKLLKFFKTRHESNNPFVVRSYVNNPGWVSNSYRRYLQNRLREVVDLEGVTVLWSFRKSPAKKKSAKN